MKVCGAILRASICLSLAAITQWAQAAALSPAEYRQQLHDLNSRVEQLREHPEQAKQFEDELPGQVAVSDGPRNFTPNYDWLKRDLQQFQRADPKNRPVFLRQIQDRFKDLDAEAQAYEDAQSASAPDQKKDQEKDQEKLKQILARREFHRAHGPSWLDVLKQKIGRWILDFFIRHPIIGRGSVDFLHILVYLTVAVAFIMFAIWLVRRFQRPKEEVSREIVPFAPSARGWGAWLADARASAQRGDWRNAIHLAYWAGISFLEAGGAWKPDRARTPREYLRILGTRKPQYPTLSSLTKKFEVTWYGHQEAQAADFGEALQQLEKLGCK